MRLVLTVGLALLIGAVTSGCATKGAPVPPAGIKTHVVRKGENVWRISQRYDSTVDAIVRANGLRDSTAIRVGQRLAVPVGVKRRPSRSAKTWTKRDRRGHTPSGHTFAWPVKGTLTSKYGYRSGAHHDGLDIAVRKGTAVRAAEAGRVIHSDNGLSGYGNLIIVKHSGAFSTVYAHNRRNLVRVGEFVEKGQVIAEVGDTGRASAPHLHFEVRRDGRARNPLDYLP